MLFTTVEVKPKFPSIAIVLLLHFAFYVKHCHSASNSTGRTPFNIRGIKASIHTAWMLYASLYANSHYSSNNE